MVGGCTNTVGTSLTVFSTMKKPVSDAKKMGFASEKSVLVPQTVVSTRKNIAWVIETTASIAGTMLSDIEAVVSRPETIFSQPNTMVGSISTMVGEIQTMVPASETLVWETKTMVVKPEIIFWLTRKMVPMVRKIFSFEKTLISGIESRFCVMQTIFMMTGTTVTAAKKTVSVVPTMVFKVFTIGFVIVEQSFANPKLYFWGLSPLASLLIWAATLTTGCHRWRQ